MPIIGVAGDGDAALLTVYYCALRSVFHGNYYITFLIRVAPMQFNEEK